MYSVKTLDLLKRMKEKITHENTGPREQFAKHLEISENSLWNYIKIFRNRDIPVKFSKSGKTYFFDIADDKEVRLIWEFGLFDKEIKEE